MSYSVKEIKEILEMEGIPVSVEEREEGSCFNLFPKEVKFPCSTDIEEKAVKMFLSFYRNKNYNVFYIDEIVDSERVEELVGAIENLESPLALETSNFIVKVTTGYFSSSFLFVYANEVGAETVGIVTPNLLGV